MAWVRITKPEWGNPFYNCEIDGGYMQPGYDHSDKSLTEGYYNSRYATKYNVPQYAGTWHPGYTALPNCVGLACGAFNETVYRNRLAKNPLEQGRQYYNFNVSPSYYITQAKVLGLEVRPMSGKPPLGGIVVYPSHVAYIADVIDDDTIDIIQDGYGGWNGSGRDTPKDELWSGRRKCYRSTGWEDGNSDAYKGLGFIVNPEIDDGATIDPVLPEDNYYAKTTYGVAINNNFYSAMVYHNGQWIKATPQVYNSEDWKKSIQK